MASHYLRFCDFQIFVVVLELGFYESEVGFGDFSCLTEFFRFCGKVDFFKKFCPGIVIQFFKLDFIFQKKFVRTLRERDEISVLVESEGLEAENHNPLDGGGRDCGTHGNAAHSFC